MVIEYDKKSPLVNTGENTALTFHEKLYPSYYDTRANGD